MNILSDPNLSDALDRLIANGLTVEQFRTALAAYRTERHQTPTWTCERCGGHGYFSGVFKPFRYEYQLAAFNAAHAHCTLNGATVMSALGFQEPTP